MSDYGLTPSQTGGLGRTYMYFTGKPTYPFGYGLSYSTFKYSDVRVSPGAVSANGTVHVGFEVTNTGTSSGATVAELFASPRFTVSGVELPQRQLAGFQKTKVLAPGQSQHVNLSVKLADLSQWDENALKQVVYDGAYTFSVGPDSATAAGSGTVEVTGAITPKVRTVTVQPDQVVFNPGDTLDLTGTDPWIAPDTNPSLEQPHATADGVVEAADNDQSFADLSKARVAYRSSDPRVATVSAAGVVTMHAPGAATVDVTVNGVTGSTPLVVQDPYTLRAPSIVKPNTTITATATFTNPGDRNVSRLSADLAAPSGWSVTPTSPTSTAAVAPGQKVTATWSVTIPASVKPGAGAELDAHAAFTGAAGPYTENAVSTLTATSGATPEQVTPVITGTSPPAGSLRVVLDNPADTPTTVTAVNWRLDSETGSGTGSETGTESGTQPVSATIAPGGSATVTVPVTSISFATIYDFTVSSVISGGLSSEALSGHVTFMPVADRSLGSSWTLAQVQDGPSIDLATTADGTWESLDGTQPYGGASDLSGKVWLDWDSANLYVTANLTDDVQSEPSTGANIWQGDCLQIAATSGVPGASAAESTASVQGHYEYGAALTSLGSQLYRWIAPTEGAGQVTDATVNVTRDDTTHTTLYELAIPWSDLTSLQPAADSVFSFSLIVNDKDNGVRKGYMQWGGGIGSSKDVAGLNTAQLMPAS